MSSTSEPLFSAIASSTSVDPSVNLDCTASYSFFSVALLVIMAVIGITGNFTIIGGIYWKQEKWPSDIVLGALAGLDLTFNLVFTPCMIWMNNYKAWVRQHVWKRSEIKYEAFVCCSYSLLTISFLLTIGVTRYLGMRFKQQFANRPYFYGPISVGISLAVSALTIGISVIAPEIYVTVVSLMFLGLIAVRRRISENSITFLEPTCMQHFSFNSRGTLILITAFNFNAGISISVSMYLFPRRNSSSSSSSSSLSTAQRHVTISLIYTTIISVIVLIPCMTTMFIWFWSQYNNMYFNGLSYSCATFIVTNILHHPLMAINFSFHPVIILVTSSIYRNDCYIFLRKLSMASSKNSYVISNRSVSTDEP